MMTLRLNLLPPQKKTGLAAMVRYLFAKEMLEFTIFTCALLATAYLSSWYVLSQALNDLASSSLLVNRELPTVNQEIRRINTLTKEIGLSGAGYAPVTPYIIQIASTLPPAIRLTSLTIDTGSGAVGIAGMAKTRAAFLDYQKILSASPWLEGVNTPTSQLFQKENVNFEIRARLKK
ncbi:MAG: PilN domain-containing protein [Candidatus Magasanikbacteria bacterium]|nr:PilN domain-containing protein [Candidatus Magasanikbacteria bacterium]